jgi:hypothetical protein
LSHWSFVARSEEFSFTIVVNELRHTEFVQRIARFSRDHPSGSAQYALNCDFQDLYLVTADGSGLSAHHIVSGMLSPFFQQFFVEIGRVCDSLKFPFPFPFDDVLLRLINLFYVMTNP